MVWGMSLLALGSVVLGVAPQLAVNYFLNPILGALGLGAGVHVTWLGMTADAGSFSTTGGLALALVSLVLGGIIYAVAYAARQTPAVVVVSSGGAALAGGGIFTGGEPLSEQDRLTASDFSSIFLQNWHEFFRWSNVDSVYLAAWSGLQAVSSALGAAVSWMERHAAILVIALSALMLAAVRWLVPPVAQEAASLPTAASLPVPPMLVAACAVAAIALILAALSGKATRTLTPFMVLTAAAAVAGIAISNSWLGLGLLELAALFTIPLVLQSARTGSAKRAYVAVVVISALALVASHLLLERGQLGARAPAHQRLRQAGRGSVLLLAAAAGR
jgi:hypothetical protein